ncbi:MAG TPA: MFS transporter, partial [Thermomicrobiales bacterium]|nr:MFS transporter [Thermomicrobiales bacterium]
LFAGVWLDRVRRRPVMIAADFVRAALLLAIPGLAWLGALRIESLVAIGLLLGVLTVFFDVAEQAYVPTLVRPDQLVEANSRRQTNYAFAEVAGPGLAGGLIQGIGAPAAVIIDAASFVVSALLLRRIRAPEPAPASGGRRSLWREIGEGLAEVGRNPILRTLAASTGVWNLFAYARNAMLIVFLARDLRLGAGAIGLVFTIGSLGFLAGTLLPMRAAARLGLGRAIVCGIIGTMPGSILIPLAGGPPQIAAAMVALGLALQGIADPSYDVNQFSLRQAVIPPSLQGRLAASVRVIIRGVVPIGAVLGGALAGPIGLRGVMWVGALGAPLALAIVWFSRVRSLQRAPAPTWAEADA